MRPATTDVERFCADVVDGNIGVITHMRYLLLRKDTSERIMAIRVGKISDDSADKHRDVKTRYGAAWNVPRHDDRF